MRKIMSSVPLFYPYITPKIINAAIKVLNTKEIGQGKKIEEFEEKFGRFIGQKYCVAVSSGTAALHLAYILTGIKSGDEVISPVLTCTATHHPLKQMGAEIIFADIKKNNLTIDEADVEKKITPKTKAIVAVHLGGYPANIKALQKFNLPIIEDAAQALGARGINQGNFTCYSFQAIKHITTIDGGMLVCGRKEDYLRAKRLRWYGIDRELRVKFDTLEPFKQREMTFDIDEVGYKYNMSNVQAAMGIAGLGDLPRILKWRRYVSDYYFKRLKHIKEITFLEKDEKRADWLFTILAEKREELQQYAKDRGVETNVVQVRNDIYKLFGGKRLELPNINEIEHKRLSIPLHFRLTFAGMQEVVSVIKSFYNAYS